MTESIRAYLLSVVAAALLTSILLAVIPGGLLKRTATLVSGLFLILVCINPFYEVSWSDLAQSISRMMMQQEQQEAQIEVHSLDVACKLIKQQTESYILDKAASMGLNLDVEVTVSTDAEYPYPSAVRLTGTVTKQQRESLAQFMEDQLAVPAAAQEWG